MTTFGRDVLNDYTKAIRKEWLVTNGIGGFASSTVIGCNTRRYHGLLIASMEPPVKRAMLVSKLDEVVKKGNEYYFLATNKYPETLSPQGYHHASSFSSEPFPKTVFSVDNVFVEKEVFMVYGENTTVITYNITSPAEEVLFSISPLVVCRDFHWLMRENMNFFTVAEKNRNEIVMRPFENMPEIHIRVDGMNFEGYGVWYKNMEYEVEQQRGLNYQEDLFNPGKYSTYVSGKKTISVILSNRDVNDYDPLVLRELELKRLKGLIRAAGCKDSIDKSLVITADKFIVRKKKRLKSIIAGYHWFNDWGRDAMVSLPGLLLETNRFEDAKKVFQAFASSMKRGIIPNLFTDNKGVSEYNTIDASLWFIYAGYQYFVQSEDKDFTHKKLLPWFEEIYSHYMQGTLYNIKVDTDGLVSGGDETTQLTWMDVKIGDEVVTGRHGKPVEVNALWYNAVKILEELTKDKKKQMEYSQLAEKIKSSFVEKFFNDEENCLYDVIYPDGSKDDSLRPNQIFAVSLKHSVLESEKEHAVFNKMQSELFTPFGLKSLCRENGSYIGRYKGNQAERDMAYHQGTVWSWLIGPYIDAYIKLNGLGEKQKGAIRRILKPLFRHLDDCGISGVSEMFDGDGPHKARGCILQAWSVAELLRLKKIIGEA